MGGVGNAGIIVAKTHVRVMPLLIGHMRHSIDKKHGFAKVFKLQSLTKKKLKLRKNENNKED